MKRLITIILALIITLFATPKQGADQPSVNAVETPQTAITVQVEQVPEESETEPAETEVFTEEKTSTEQEPEIEDCTEITEEKIKTKTEEETVECIDEGNQSIAEYKPQIGNQPNPFENDTPTEIDDRPVEDYIGEDEDRPGEGKHF